jgi:hypothetical protein
MRNLIILSAFALGGLAGCKDDCEKASDTVTAKYEDCGIEVADSDEESDVECTDELGTQSICVADCIDAADCTALDGTDSDAALELATCYTDCV